MITPDLTLLSHHNWVLSISISTSHSPICYPITNDTTHTSTLPIRKHRSQASHVSLLHGSHGSPPYRMPRIFVLCRSVPPPHAYNVKWRSTYSDVHRWVCKAQSPDSPAHFHVYISTAHISNFPHSARRHMNHSSYPKTRRNKQKL